MSWEEGTLCASRIAKEIDGSIVLRLSREALTCPPDPSNMVTEFKLDSICRFAFI
jgi:hypothetical protein